MKIGFDYWNCVSHYPEHFRWIMGAFENYAVETHIISAIGKGRIGTIADEVQALPGWGGFNPKWYETSVHEVVFEKSSQSPELKLAKCKELGIEIFFDDRKDVVDLLNKNGILAFLVPREGTKSDTESERK